MSDLRRPLLVILLIAAGCVYTPSIPHEAAPTVYFTGRSDSAPTDLFAPLFLAHGIKDDHNRIGTPTARYDENGMASIRVDPERPSVYTMVRRFETENGTFTNFIYRIHFEEVPFSLVPFHLTAGKNVGLLVVVTLDERKRAVLVTTVGTCGCYAVCIPTSHLSRDAYPEEWPQDGRVSVFGERLPAVLDVGAVDLPRIVIVLRPDVHRVMDIRVVPDAELADSRKYSVVRVRLFPMGALEALDLNGGTTSFYHESGPAEGHVKGAEKGWETLLMGLISFDFFVGTDKVYGDSRDTGNPFYTSLKPWNRKASDMWEFDRFLHFHGWRL
ncbi:MAG: hypothetical protein JRK53_08205 [Deltaproteobacteria bacterium]|nr:hypothetical protein [Deltaproteobacteria bacterium]MBW1816816.1 hypothetical protein [Deltaproteobacteria bacterium]MBW2283876.1 hypothetical protein [Deltaproteobacteria bacterium]